MHLGGVARGAGGAERSSRGREGEKFLVSTGPEGKPGGASRFPLSLKTDGVFNTERMALRRARIRAACACAAMHAPGVQNAWTEDRLK